MAKDEGAVAFSPPPSLPAPLQVALFVFGTLWNASLAKHHD
jgi:hypothetical protein